ncbi:MAG: PIG-L family deacetylase, partial [Rhodococcus sp. (in: high G+C Gram-positive bacteria)]
MSVLVCFHAHPDDEVFGTGGVMRLAADAGHRVVLVTATDGALGEFPDGILTDG